jgi:V/A-type H+-transporting ATPase subunit F
LKFYVIGDEDTVLGFQLAGVEGVAVETSEEAREALQKAFQMKDLGVIIIPERVAANMRQIVDQYLYKTTFPLIIEIPDRLGPMEGRGSIRDLVRSAVGIRL